MPLTPLIRWTDVSDKTPLPELIRLMNRRVGRGAPPDLALCHLVIGDGVNVIAPGVFGDVAFDRFPAEILSWTLVGTLPLATNGSIVLDVWNKTYGASEPAVANTIMTAGTKPTITTARQARSSAVTAWRTKIQKDDILRVNVDSAATFTQVTFSMTLAKG